MLDTNVLLDWLLDRDVDRTAKIDALLVRSPELQIPDAIIVELAFALEKFYELPRETVADNLNKVVDEPVFNCNRIMFRRAITEYLDHPALSFLDCCLMNYAELQGALPVWTFDKKLVNQSSGRAKALV
ncbi:PIN domain-containing protein [Patescibacteria group bacterium]|nr:MAG: PIN domain-containing protein [Patescibacteria group bacterium]